MNSQTVNKVRFISSVVAFSFVVIFGILFLTLASKLSQQTIPENYVMTEATITRIEENLLPNHLRSNEGVSAADYEHFVFVDYSYEGNTYSDREYANYDSSMAVGDTAILYLDPDDPDSFISDPSGDFIFVIVGIVIVLFGVGGLAFITYKKKRGNA